MKKFTRKRKKKMESISEKEMEERVRIKQEANERRRTSALSSIKSNVICYHKHLRDKVDQMTYTRLLALCHPSDRAEYRRALYGY